jgi:hypothetical protein
MPDQLSYQVMSRYSFDLTHITYRFRYSDSTVVYAWRRDGPFTCLPVKLMQIVFMLSSRLYSAFKSFKTCFPNGADGYDACVSVIGLLISANITPRQAREYVKLFARFDFACGAGLASMFISHLRDFVLSCEIHISFSLSQQWRMYGKCVCKRKSHVSVVLGRVRSVSHARFATSMRVKSHHRWG